MVNMDYRVALCLLISFFAVLPLIFLCCLKKEKHIRITLLILFIVYSIIVCVGVFTNISIGKFITFAPYENVFNSKSFNFNLITKNKQDIFINTFMLIPFGFLLCPAFKKHKIIFVTIIGFAFSCLIEILQLILPVARFAQLTDIILNTISCFIGSVLFVIINLIKNKIKK